MDQCNAQMAELVDALVSNTNEVTLVPVRLRLWVQRLAVMQAFLCFRVFGISTATKSTKFCSSIK